MGATRHVNEINHMDIKDFADLGYLQEVNRLFFHPLGLALEMTVEDDGSCRLSGVWDYRDDPEGILFGDGQVDPEKARFVSHQRWHRSADRIKALGFFIQPIDKSVLEDDRRGASIYANRDDT